MENSLSAPPGKNLSASHASEIVPSRKLSQWSFAKLAGCLLYFSPAIDLILKRIENRIL